MKKIIFLLVAILAGDSSAETYRDALGYYINVSVRVSSGYLEASGYIDGGPPCKSIQVVGHFKSIENGEMASVLMYAEKVGGASKKILEGKQVYRGKSEYWKSVAVKASCVGN